MIKWDVVARVLFFALFFARVAGSCVDGAEPWEPWEWSVSMLAALLLLMVATDGRR